MNKKSTADLYKNKVKRKINSDSVPELYYKLFTGLEEIIGHGQIVAYKFLFKRYELSKSGKKFHPNAEALTDRIFENEAFTAKQIGLDKRGKPDILKEKNDEELKKILSAREYFLKQYKRISNKKTKRQLKFINRVIKDFEDWYLANGIEIPTIVAKNKRMKVSTEKKKTLTERLKELCESDTLPLYETVDSTKVYKYLRTVKSENLTNSNKPETIRKILSRLGYSKTRII